MSLWLEGKHLHRVRREHRGHGAEKDGGNYFREITLDGVSAESCAEFDDALLGPEALGAGVL